MSTIYFTPNQSIQEMQAIIDASEPWTRFVFTGTFTFDSTLHLKGTGREYVGSMIYLTPDFQGSVIEVVPSPLAKRNLFQWIGYWFLRLIRKHPRTTGATITGFYIHGNGSTHTTGMRLV